MEVIIGVIEPPPQIPCALILKYAELGAIVLNPVSGSGTACIEALLLSRNRISVDINCDAAVLTHHRLHYLLKALREVERRTASPVPSPSCMLQTT
jgi:tRNA G10  N-methylase Trm11